MFRFLFKFIVLPILLLVVAVAGTAAYLLLTPVTESNVKTRIWQACMIGAAAQTFNNAGRRAPRPVYSSAQCGCVGDTLVQQLGAATATKGAESVRGFLEAGLRNWISGGDYRELQRQPDALIADVFVSNGRRITKACGNSGG
jgi:hypothetical protein